MLNFLTEAKQSLVNLGIPEIIASLFQQKFGKNAFIIAKWYKEYESLGRPENKNWWRDALHGFSKPGIVAITDLYLAMKDFVEGRTSFEEYNQIRDRLGFAKIRPGEEGNSLSWVKDHIEKDLFEEVFFSQNLIKDIMAGKLKDLKPYAKLPFSQANQSYEEKTIFNDKTPIKTYSNGWKWINVGERCDLVGKQMKNCGSTGLMSMDRNRTMITLFDSNNIPHVVATYSPGENRLSGVEGQASTGIKDEYTDYVIDLTKTLNAELDISNTKSKMLKLKFLLNPLNIQRIEGSNDYNEFYLVELQTGKSYYTDSYSAVSKEATDNLSLSNASNLFQKLKQVFDYNTKDSIMYANPGFKYIHVQALANSNIAESLKLFINETIRSSLKSLMIKSRG
jgi:hypothetical protein